MVKDETLHIRVNGEVKKKAEETLEILGLTISEAVNTYLHQIPLVGGIPFEIKKPTTPDNAIMTSSTVGTKSNKKPYSSLFGSLSPEDYLEIVEILAKAVEGLTVVP